MRRRAYDEFGRKLQIYWHDTNLETCGNVWEMRLEVGDVLRSLSCVKAGKQARDTRSTFYKTCCGSCVEGEGVRPDAGSLTLL